MRACKLCFSVFSCGCRLIRDSRSINVSFGRFRRRAEKSPNKTHFKIHYRKRPFLQEGAQKVAYGATRVSEDGHQVNWLGASESEEAVSVLTECRIDALKRRAEGQAAQWQLRDSL